MGLLTFSESFDLLKERLQGRQMVQEEYALNLDLQHMETDEELKNEHICL